MIIPSEIEGKPVTEIDEDAFKCCLSLASVTIPEHTSVDGEAFAGCDDITITRR